MWCPWASFQYIYIYPPTGSRRPFCIHGPGPLDFGFGVLKMFWSCFRSLLDLFLELYVGRLLAPCWALGGSFFEVLRAHKISSCFASVSEWFRSLSEMQKLSSRVGENQILDLLHVLCWVSFRAPFGGPKSRPRGSETLPDAILKA